jgi:predicted P-loop ATPase
LENESAKSSPIKRLKYDGSITIATGRSRKEMNWKNREMLWSELAQRLSASNFTGETHSEYMRLPKSQQDQIKDIGGFVGGALKGGRRKTEAVAFRSVLTLDADFVKGNLWDAVEMMFDFACLAYSTHKHTPSKPRLRLVIPLSRAVTSDEYQAISRRVAADIGIDFFDDTTYQPHRLMYWPSTSKDGEFIFKIQDEPWLNPDDVLARYPDWRDPSYWPESSRQKQEHKKLAEKQGDPYEKPGMVGAFCRTYSIPEVIEKFLKDVYEPAQEGRYTYIEGSTTGGLILYENDKFAYSHHGTDPVGGKLVNAFDLVRIHRFGEMDMDADPATPVAKLPSYLAMTEFAQKDENVRQEIVEKKLAQASEEFGDLPEEDDKRWMKNLSLNKKGQILPEASNIKLILRNDPNLKGKFALNDFTHRYEILDDLPWRKRSRGDTWGDADDSCLRNYLSTVYNIKAPSVIRDAFNEVAERNAFHPVREYLEGLEWDGIERLDTLLIDYLGAEDSPYTRAVTRKMLVAAVARIERPGIKFDNVLVLVGPQGVGKSYIIKLLGQKWHSDSLTTVQGKEAYEQLQGAWLIELAELSATRRAETEAVKHFITKQEDSYRKAYGRQISVFPRQCVFFGTTNEDTFLRDRTGNRRFWPVRVYSGEHKKSLWKDLTRSEVDQVWAEALTLWRDGEPLYLDKELQEIANEVQEAHLEVDDKFGIVQEFLERKLPEDWADRSIVERRQYLHGGDFGAEEEGTVLRDRVCAMEIWCELFEKEPESLVPMRAREINDIMRRMPGWKPYEKSRGRMKFGSIYGAQRAFVRA